jgi:Holliday junction resolvase-like predicted endonuclease
MVEDSSKKSFGFERRKMGQCAELLVRHWYESRGFEVLHQNLYLGHDELDLVVRSDASIRVVEVRSSSKRDAIELAWSVPGSKAKKLKRATRKLVYSGLLEGAAALYIDLALVRWLPNGRPEIRIWESALSLRNDD